MLIQQISHPLSVPSTAPQSFSILQFILSGLLLYNSAPHGPEIEG